MKNLLLAFTLGILLIPVFAWASPTSVNRITDHIQPLIISDYINATFFTATSTTATSTFPNASTTNLKISSIIDNGGSKGTAGQLLQSNGTANFWTATSGLGIALSDTKGVLSVAKGGNGTGSYTTGDILYASGAATLAKLGIGATGTVLSSVAGLPSWQATSSLNITGGAGTNYFNNSGANTFLNTGTNLQAPTTQATSTTGTSTITNALVIGTSSPTYSTSTLTLYNTNTPGVSPAFTLVGNPGGDTDFWCGRANDNDGINNDFFACGTGINPATSTSKFTLSSTGLFGIGTTSPLATLDVSGIAGFLGFRVSSSSGASLLEVEQSGNVGIGTTTPTSLLTVAGDIALKTGSFIKSGTNTIFGGNGFNTLLRPDSSGGDMQFQSYAGGTNVSFKDGGSVGIASTTPVSLLGVMGTTTTQGLRLTNIGLSSAVFLDGNGNATTTAPSSFLLSGLTDETGTGVAVFGTSPSFTTRITTPSIRGGTAVGASLDILSTTGVGTSDFIRFLTGNSLERGRISTGGQWSIGTTSVLTGNLLTVASTTALAFYARGTSTFDGGISVGGSAAPTALFSLTGIASTTIANITNSIGTKILEIVDNTLTALGTWNFSGARLLIPNGSNPPMDAVGSIALDTTDNQVLVSTSTETGAPGVLPITQSMGSFIVSSTSFPFFTGFAAGKTIPFKIQRDGYTATEIYCDVDGGTSIVIDFNNGTGDTSSTTCGLNGTSLVGLGSNTVVAAGATTTLIKFGAISGTPDYIRISVFGTFTRE